MRMSAQTITVTHSMSAHSLTMTSTGTSTTGVTTTTTMMTPEQMGCQYVQFPLMEAQSSILARGPKSAVVPRHPPKGEYITSVEEVCLHLPPP